MSFSRQIFVIGLLALLSACTSVPVQPASGTASVVEASRGVESKDSAVKAKAKDDHHVSDLSILHTEDSLTADHHGGVSAKAATGAQTTDPKPQPLVIVTASPEKKDVKDVDTTVEGKSDAVVKDVVEKKESASTTVKEKKESKPSTSSKKQKPVVNRKTSSRGAAPPVRKKSSSKDNKGNSASRSLLSSSRKMLSQGQYRLAANHAERALRVSPRNPYAYYQLALIYQKQSNCTQARHFAAKGLSQNGVSSSLRSKLSKIQTSCK